MLLYLVDAFQVITASKFMHNIFIIFPGFILSLSLFQFSFVLHRFQTTFDSLTPSVIQRYVSYEIQDSFVYFWLDPEKVSTGIEFYFFQQLRDDPSNFEIEFTFFDDNQITICSQRCMGVLTQLNVRIGHQFFSFSRHYQLV